MIFKKYIPTKTNGQLFYFNVPVADFEMMLSQHRSTVKQCYLCVGPPMEDTFNRRFSKCANTHVSRIKSCSE